MSLLGALRAAAVLAVRSDRRGVVSLALLAAFDGAAAGASLFIVQQALGAMVEDPPSDSWDTAAGWLLALLALMAVTEVAAALRELRQETFTERVSRRTGLQILDAVSELDLIAFESSNLYDTLQRVTSALEYRPVLVIQSLVALTTAAAGSIVVLLALAALQPLLIPLLVLAQLPVWVALRLRHRDEESFVRFATPLERQRSYVRSILTSRDTASEVRSFALADHLRAKYVEFSRQQLTELRARVRRRARWMVSASIASSVANLVVVGCLLILYRNGPLGLAGAGTALYGFIQIRQRFGMMNAAAGQMYESAIFLAESEEFLREARAASSPRQPAGTPVRPGVIRVQSVSFTYPGSARPALTDVDLTVRPGEVVALVGENGSGKTTLAKLMASLYRPSTGTISWDGRDIHELDVRAVRASVTVVFQDYVRYMFSAAENIGLGRTERIDDRSAIEQAAEAARASELISKLPDGYDTVLGRQFADGHDLSRGQWQRLAIARAFFRDAPLIILDEPTAALDPRAEEDLFQRTQELFRDRTVILISHRFSTVRRADRIYVLDDGRIVEAGDHDELMKKGGQYAHLFTLQAAGFTEESG